jgi:hypothetical protein
MRIMKEMIMMSQKKLNPNLNLRLIKIQNLLLNPPMMIVMDIILRKNNQNTLVITLLQICLRD